MQVRCPNCNGTMETLDPVSQEGLVCANCGEKFDLIDDETKASGPQSGELVGHFRLMEIVGHGGFGVVWRALDTELDRIVAVKTPKAGLIAADEANQFVREARAAAQLKHPNIVAVHEVGRIDDFLYIVSDFIEGGTLAEWLKDNRATIRESAEICVTISEALHHAHQSGVVHRDVKPANILLDPDGTPNIADFGLALRQIGDTTVTFDGNVVGTPSYMSPEQASGDFIDHRTDVYSMGVMLFFLMTGEKPFRGNHRMILNQVINDDAPSPRRLNGTIPRDLETICLKCLQKSPGHRYQSAQNFADDLRRFLSGEPISARPIRTYERIWKWALRRPLVASLLTAFALAVVLGLTGVTWQWRQVVASQQRHALTQVKLIRNAEPREVESAIAGLDEFRRWTDPELRRLTSDTTLPTLDRFRGHLALLKSEPQRAAFIIEQLVRNDPAEQLDFDELALGIDVLATAGAVPEDQLIKLATDTTLPNRLRFRVLFMLARASRFSANEDAVPWDELSDFSVRQLVERATQTPSNHRTLVDAFRPVWLHLLSEFRKVLASDRHSQNERFTAATIVAEHLANQPEQACDLLLEVRAEEYPVILAGLKPHAEVVNRRFAKLLGKQHASNSEKTIAAITMLHLNDEPSGVWPLFRHSPDNTLRTHLIHQCSALQLPPEKLATRLAKERDVSVRQAILLALGDYLQLEDAFRNQMRPELEDMYRHDPDAGIHSSVAWLLRSWGRGDLVKAMDAEPPFSRPVSDRQWYVNSQGTTMVVIDHPDAYMMGASKDEPLRTKFDRQHLRKVNRKFAIASTEVTWEQFQKFVADYPATNQSHPADYGPDPDGPILAVSWVHAAKYCRWLSDKENISPDQMCFPGLDDIREDMQLPDDLMERTGYRLPSEGEWECACRAGTVTQRFFGDSDKYLNSYGWHIGNSLDYAWEVGLLKPNNYGLFDVYGNAWEWCLDRHGSLPYRPGGDVFIDVPKLVGTKPRMLRGGSMNSRSEALRSAQRDFIDALHNRNHNVGLRLVRTLPNND